MLRWTCTLLVAPICAAQTIEERVDWIERRLEHAMAEHHVPGLAIVVVKDGEPILERGFGVADLESGRPATSETLFAIGSHTKAMTSFLVAQEVDAGRMSFEDRITAHIPWFTLSDEKANEQTTIADLLSHRTGYNRMTFLFMGGGLERDEILRRAGTAESYRPFRSSFLYNNVMYAAAGYASEASSGMAWDDMVRSRIFEPLDMATSVATMGEFLAIPDASRSYMWLDGEHVPTPPQPIDGVGPAGTVGSTAVDMGHWITMLLDEGVYEGERLVGLPELEQCWQPWSMVSPQMSYGLGWFVQSWEGRRVLQHGGNIGGFATSCAIMPDDEVGFCLMMNAAAVGLQEKAIDLVFTGVFGALEEPVEPTPVPIESYLGLYQFSQLDTTVTALRKDGRLAIDIPGQMTFTLEWPDEEGLWQFEITDGISVEFVSEEDEVTGMKLHQAGQTFEMPRIEPPEPPFTEAEVRDIRDRWLPDAPPPALRLRGTANWVHQGAAGDVEWIVSDDRFAQRIELGVLGHVRQIFDGKDAWSESTGSPAQRPTGARLHQVATASEAFSPYGWTFDSIEATGLETLEGVETVVLKATLGDAPPVTLWMDIETGRVLKERVSVIAPGVGSVPTMTTYSGFEPVDGVDLPTRIHVENAFAGRLELDVEAGFLDQVHPAWFRIPKE